MRMKFAAIVLCLLSGVPDATTTATGTSPWPAENNTDATVLTSVDAGLNAINWSGAAWNSDTRTLWLACNTGYFWALVEDGAGSFRVATNALGIPAKWASGHDLESICQADFQQPIVYLLDENGWIREYSVSNYGVVAENRNWDIRVQCPEVGGALGAEGITFVPDEWLRREGFRGTNGSLCVSTNGMGGLMFVGHQSGGYVHVFDLNGSNTSFGYIGRYATGRAETAGLEFDRINGTLHIWHNTGNNYLEITELNSYVDGSDRRLRPLVEYVGPRTGNLEGFALVTTPDSNTWCFITDDDNAGGEALVWYHAFLPTEDVDADNMPDGWELWHFGSTTQSVGSADADLDGMINAYEFTAGTDPTNPASVFSLLPPELDHDTMALSWNSVTGKVYTVTSALDLQIGFTQSVLSAITATAPVSRVSVAIPDVGAFYEISVAGPP